MKMLRYAGVSTVNSVLGLVLLIVFHDGLDWSGENANVASVSLSAIPAYLMSRTWVWEQDGRSRFTTEVAPFWGLTFLGLLASTIAVAWAERNFDGFYVVYAANMSAFFVVWLMRYAIFEKFVWTEVADPDPALPQCLDDPSNPELV